MTDIVERLQKATLYEGNGELSALPEEAADEIVALRAENEKLRAALHDVLGWHDYSNDMHKPIEVRAAIAVVLEEAAKEVEKWQQVHFDDGGNMHVSNITSTIAAAIRALVKT